MNGFTPPKMRQLVTEAVFRRKRAFWCVVLPVVFLVAVGSFLMPKRYRSQAKLMVQPVRSMGPLTTTPTDRLVAANQVAPEEINSEVDLLESQSVARRALGQSLTANPSKQDEATAKALSQHLTVDAVHQTDLINVSFVGKSPEEATATLRRVLNAYFEQRAGSGISSGAAGFFERQVQAKNEQLTDDQTRLTQFEVTHGIADLDDQKKLQVERISGLQNQLMAAQAQLAGLRSKTAANKRELSLTPARSRTIERTITNQYSQERLSTSLVDLENRRTELAKRYAPSDRQLVEIDEKIATTKKAIAAEGNSPAGETATDVNPVYQQLSLAVASSVGEASAESAQVAELTAQLKDARERLAELEQSTAEYNELKRRLGQAQADYSLYAQRRDEARISEALDRAKMFNVSLAESPVASSVPVRPKPGLYIAAGTVFAVLLGVLVALYIDTASEQVYTPSQLDARTGTRTIATLAEEREGESVEESNRLEYRRILLAIRQALEVGLTGGAGGHCVAFVSPLRGEGVSHLVDHLAKEAAIQASSRVVVLDVEPLLKKFEAEDDVSLKTKYDAERLYWVQDLGESQSGRAAAHSKSMNVHGLFSQRLRPLLVEARKDFDFVFLDCPSQSASTIAAELARSVDGYVAVVAAGHARKQNIEGLIAALTDTSAPLLGWVLTRRTYPVPRWMHRVLW